MICAVCYGVLRGHQGSQWRGTFDLHFDHQRNRTELEKSVAIRCAICRSISSELKSIDKTDRSLVVRALNGVYSSIGKLIWGEPQGANGSNFIGAYLSEVPELQLSQEPKIYRLDFKLLQKDEERLGTFVLEKVDAQSSGSLHTPFSSNTSSDEVLEVAKGWIRTCTSSAHPDCPGELPEVLDFYPDRLIDLGDMVESVGHRLVRDDPPDIATDEEKARKKDAGDSDYVRLVSSKDDEGNPIKLKGYYVTLSHCWGAASFIKLTENNLGRLKKAINVKDLPKTFEDAIRFARRLGDKPGQVRYIWIDSLCIMQAHKPSQAQVSDWLKQSSVMHEIYRNSYCNISATAATDSNKGLFADREPQLLWEDEINLNTEEIPGYDPSDLIQRCKILDLSFWERNVDEAPVNKRAWVLQERLMAPRVLHFCKDQIAWECRKLDASESFRDGLSNFRLKAGEIERAERLKMFVPHATGGLNSSHHTATPERHATYSHWKSVVERYSKTKLTNPGDKLIALSGIAKLMAGLLPGVKYVAGLWSEHLASQLLWRVDPVFEHGKFSFPSSRPKQYRAPSFSWAAVDAERGITYGEFTDENLLIKVAEYSIYQEKGSDPFGLVNEGCTIKLSGVLKKVELQRRVGEDGLIRYRWDLSGSPPEAVEKYSNVYLDSPHDDTDILDPDSQIFCLPAMIPPMRGRTPPPEESVQRQDDGGSLRRSPNRKRKLDMTTHAASPGRKRKAKGMTKETAQSVAQTHRDNEGNTVQSEPPVRRDDEGYIICLLLQKDKKRPSHYKRIGLTKVPPYDAEGQRKLYDPDMSESDRAKEREDFYLV
ncbi:HET-domain-containing protein [Stipitochalara longipes BDJ]|nr:HET-domain-containing protein [Stipitochalara longipes BDJ]